MMTRFDIKCCEKTYQDPLYWDNIYPSQLTVRQRIWIDCRGLTDSFYEELILRGYFVPKKD